MNYRSRYLEAKVLRYRTLFPALLITGARQVGKSTLLSRLVGKEARHVTFDPVIDIGNARIDPEFFLDQYPPRSSLMRFNTRLSCYRLSNVVSTEMVRPGNIS